MPSEPSIKRAVAFFDGQNLFHKAKDAFGHGYPNYDVRALAAKICGGKEWQLKEVRFYSGIPRPEHDARWNHFWTAKFAQMGRQNIHVVRRFLHYHRERVKLPDGNETTTDVAREKGIDVRLALDVIRLAHRREFDVALVFSQDQDLSEVADEIRELSKEQDRWIKVACAFPFNPDLPKSRGINGTDWILFDRSTYDDCLDPRDYRRKPKPAP